MAGIKETKEALIAGAAILKVVEGLGADGYQIGDLFSFIDKYNNDAVFAGKVNAGIENSALIQEELKDLNFLEIIELVRMLPDIFKK